MCTQEGKASAGGDGGMATPAPATFDAGEPATLDAAEAEGPHDGAGGADLDSFLDDAPAKKADKKEKKDKKDKKEKKKKKERDAPSREDFQQLLSPGASGKSSPKPIFTASEYVVPPLRGVVATPVSVSVHPWSVSILCVHVCGCEELMGTRIVWLLSISTRNTDILISLACACDALNTFPTGTLVSFRALIALTTIISHATRIFLSHSHHVSLAE